MKAWRMSSIILGLAFVAGCAQEPRPPQTPEQLNGRMEAAGKIANLSEKSDAYKVIAVDAADSGVVDVVVKAIDGIPNISTRDDAAETCALKLMKRGDTKAATTVAEKISNLAKKNEVLSKIAKGR
jgi:hypothetical protein